MTYLRLILVAAALVGLVPAETMAGSQPSAGAGDGEQPVVYVIPIRGMIEPALLYVVRRGVAEAEREKAEAIIFVMDTPGGTVDAARDIVFTIQNISVPTITFVEKDAFSAGAIIALATRSIYMAPGSVIGAAMPVMMSPIGGAQEMPEGVEEKTVSAVAALIRAAAEQGGHDKELAEAMVRREIEFSIDGELIKPKGQLLTLTNEEAQRPVGPEGRPLLAAGTVSSLSELLESIGMGEADIRTLRVTRSERVARFIAMLGPLLLMAGLLGIYLEVRTPGFGLPGILGLTALALFFWGHHIAGLAGVEDLVIFALGAVLLAVELLAFPGFGLLGIGGTLLMALGLLMAMVQRYPGGPLLPSWPDVQWPVVKMSLALVGTALAAAVVGKFLPSAPLFRKMILAASTDSASGYTAAGDSSLLEGKQGVAATDLRPGGVALVEGRRRDVVTRGQFLEAGTPLRVVEARGSHLVVEPVRQQA